MPSTLYFFYCAGHHRDLHSFPTRRSSDLGVDHALDVGLVERARLRRVEVAVGERPVVRFQLQMRVGHQVEKGKFQTGDRKSTRLNSSHITISYAVFCLKKKNKNK